MRVLLCTNVYPPKFIGGAELVVHNYAKALQQLGHEPIVFTGDIRGERDRHTLWKEDWDGVTAYRVSLNGDDFRSDFVNFVHYPVEKHFETVLGLVHPDVAHMHNLIGLSARLIHLAKRRGVRTLLTLHDYWGFCYKNTLLKTESEVCTDYSRCSECRPFIHDGAEKSIPIQMRNDFLAHQFAELDALVSPSLHLAKVYAQAGFPLSRMRVIWNGVDVERFARVRKTPNQGRIRFTFIGHFGTHKGLVVLLNALPLLGDSERFQINLVGQGELMNQCQERVADLGLAGSVRFWGQLQNDHIDQAFAETDVLVLPSIWQENQPVSITEAMATSTPVIASRIGGIPELVEEGRTGYLFKTGDSSDLAEKMRIFIDYPDRLTLFGQRAFAKIATKTYQNQVKQVLRVYEESRDRSA